MPEIEEAMTFLDGSVTFVGEIIRRPGKRVERRDMRAHLTRQEQ